MNVWVKEISANNLDEYYKLFSRLLSTQFPDIPKKNVEHFLKNDWSKDRYLKSIKENRRVLFGAWLDKKLIGVLDADTPFGGVSLITWIIVDSDYQKKGVGKEMLSKFEKEMINKGAHSIFLHADKRNIGYYEQLGYGKLGLWENSWFGGDIYVYTKTIQKPKSQNYFKGSRY